MPLVLDDTVGGANANTFVSLANAETYFLSRPFADAWNNASSTQKNQVLAYATILLDQQKWKGAKGSTPGNAITQALAWPRVWSPTLEADANPEFVAEYFIDLSVGYYSSLTIPDPIVKATCELALELLRAGSTDPLTLDKTRNVARKSIGNGAIDTEYVPVGQRVQGLGHFPQVVALIAPLLRGGMGEVERV